MNIRGVALGSTPRKFSGVVKAPIGMTIKNLIGDI